MMQQTAQFKFDIEFDIKSTPMKLYLETTKKQVDPQ